MYNAQYNGGRNQYGFSPYRSGGGNGYGRGNWNNNYNNRNWQPNNFQMQRPVKKRSGATFGYAHGEQTRPYVRGWKFDRTHGLRAFIASPNKKTKRTTSKTGQNWENWTAKVTTPHGVQLYNALYHIEKKRVYIQDLALVMSPNSPGGGYTGPFFRRKQR